MNESLTEALDRILASAPKAESEYPRVSKDFFDIDEDENSYEEMERLSEEFAAEYHEMVKSVTADWGEPTFEGSWEDEGFPDWFDAIRFATWKRDGGMVYIAYQHEDKEVPIMLILGAVTADELKRLEAC